MTLITFTSKLKLLNGYSIQPMSIELRCDFGINILVEVEA